MFFSRKYPFYSLSGTTPDNSLKTSLFCLSLLIALGKVGSSNDSLSNKTNPESSNDTVDWLENIGKIVTPTVASIGTFLTLVTAIMACYWCKKNSSKYTREEKQEIEKELVEKARTNQWKEVEHLIKKYGHRIDINHVDSEGNSVLHYAVNRNDLSAVQFLISKKADATVTNTNGRTPLHEAMKSAIDASIAQCLLDKGIVNLNIKDNTEGGGKTAYDLALKSERKIKQTFLKDNQRKKLDMLKQYTPISPLNIFIPHP